MCVRVNVFLFYGIDYLNVNNSVSVFFCSKLIMKLSEEVPHKLYSKYKPSSESTRPSPLTTERKQSHSGQSKTK